jgi:hypothetical protein
VVHLFNYFTERNPLFVARHARNPREHPTAAAAPSSVTIAPAVADQIKRCVEHLFHLGPRPVFELLCGVAGGGDVIDELRAYQRLDPATVRYLGADRLPRRQRNECRRALRRPKHDPSNKGESNGIRP